MLLCDGANCCFLLCIFFCNPETLWNQEAPIFRRIRHGGKFLDFQTKAGLWRSVASGKFCAVVVSKPTHLKKDMLVNFGSLPQVGLNMNKHIWSHHLVCCYHQINMKHTFFKTICTVGLNAVNSSTSCLGNRGEWWRMIFVGMFFPIRFSRLIQQAKNQLPVFASLNHAFRLKWLIIHVKMKHIWKVAAKLQSPKTSQKIRSLLPPFLPFVFRKYDNTKNHWLTVSQCTIPDHQLPLS